MEKICLVEAGSYLLGIDAAAIIRKLSADSFIAGEREHETSLISLASLLDRQALALPQTELFVLEMKTTAEPLTLVVDRILKEIDAPNRFEPLPLLYPELARCCCPQMMIHEGQVVLLLDGDGLDSVRARLKPGCGVITLDELRDREADTIATVSEEMKTEDVAEPVVEEFETEVAVDDVNPEYENGSWSSAVEDVPVPDDDTEKDIGIVVSDPEETFPVDNSGSSNAEPESEQPEIEIDDAIFGNIVSWTLSRYIECENKSTVAINAGELPSGFIRHQGMSHEIAQAIINKTLMRCEKMDDESLRRKIGAIVDSDNVTCTT